MSKVEEGKVVEIDYTLRLDNGEIADTTEGQPLAYLHGGDDIIEGLHAALDGHAVGDSFEVSVQPGDAWGDYDEERIEEMPRSDIPEGVELEVGQEVVAESDDGEEVPGYVGAIEDDVVYLDFNHPLAGEVLNYQVKVVSVRDATDEEKKRGYIGPPDEEPDDHDH